MSGSSGSSRPQRTKRTQQLQDVLYDEVVIDTEPMETPADRLRKLRIRKGYTTAKDAARAFGWNEHTYTSHENGVRGIKLDVARKYANAYNSTPAYILTASSVNSAPVINDVINVPLLAIVSAGIFREADGLHSGGILVPAVPRSDIPASAQYCVKVDGPSVNLKIADGAYAICARYESYPGGAQHGQLVHVQRERAGLFEETIKELRFTREGPMLMPVSDDPRFQAPVKLDDGEDDTTVTIRGVVIGKFEPL